MSPSVDAAVCAATSIENEASGPVQLFSILQPPPLRSTSARSRFCLVSLRRHQRRSTAVVNVPLTSFPSGQVQWLLARPPDRQKFAKKKSATRRRLGSIHHVDVCHLGVVLRPPQKLSLHCDGRRRVIRRRNDDRSASRRFEFGRAEYGTAELNARIGVGESSRSQLFVGAIFGVWRRAPFLSALDTGVASAATRNRLCFISKNSNE